MKHPIFMLALSLAVIAADANAQPAKKPAAKKPANPPACDGLKSVAGKFTDNLKKRKQMDKGLCESKGLERALAGVRKQLKSCEALTGKRAGKGINVDIFFPDIKARADKACATHHRNKEVTESVCTQYDVAVAKTTAANQSFIDAGLSSGQASDFVGIAKMHEPLVGQYKLFSASMKDMEKQINTNMPGLQGNSDPAKTDPKGAIDPVMDKAIFQLRGQIKSLTAAKKAQLNAVGAARVREAGKQGDEGTIRFGTTEEANKYSENLVECEAAAKDGGALDQFNKHYQSTLAKSLTVSQVENHDLAKQFQKQSDEHAEAQKSAEETSQHLARSNSTNSAVRNVASGTAGPLSTGLSAASSQAKGDALMKSNGGDVDKAEAWLRARRITTDGTVVQSGGTSYRVFTGNTWRGPVEYYLPVRAPSTSGGGHQ